MFQFNSIKTKLMVIFFVLIFLPMVILGITAYFITYDAFEDITMSSADQLVEVSAEKMQDKINSMQEYLTALSINSTIISSVDGDSEIKDKVFNLLSDEQKNRGNDVESFALADRSGMCFMTSTDKNAVIDLKDRTYVQKALRGEVAISSVLQSKTTGDNVITIAVPLKENGRIVGTLIGVLKFNAFTEEVEHMTLGQEGYAYMIDQTGLFVSHPDENKVLVDKLNGTDNKALNTIAGKMIAGESGSGFYIYEGVEKYVSYHPVGDFTVALVDSKSDYMAPAKRIGFVVILVAVISIIAAMLIAFIFSNSMVKRIKNIRDCADQLALGDTDVNIIQKSKDEIGQLIGSFGRMVEGIKQQSQVANQISQGNFDVDIQVRSDKDILNKSLEEMVNNINATYNEIKKIIKHVEKGNFALKDINNQFVGGWEDIVMGTYDILDKVNGYFNLLPLSIMTLDKEHHIQYLNKKGNEILNISEGEATGKSCFDFFKTGDCNSENCACKIAMKEERAAFSDTTVHVGEEPMYINYIGIPMKNGKGEITGAFKVIMDQTKIKKAQMVSDKQAKYQKQEVEKLVLNLEKLSRGYLDVETSVKEADEDTKEIADNFIKINDSLKASTNIIKSYINELSEILGQMADKNLTSEISREYVGDFITLKNSINNIIEQFNVVLTDINSAAEQVESGADQVASSSQNLSQGASEQAGSIEEIGATTVEVAEQTKDNAVKADKANEISTHVKSDAQNGNKQMAQMLKAMDEIKDSSKNISNIIKVIDEIAFQTNILALNAAVEAARAGEHGKGFAVVAEEVRNLAARSAKAAKETTDLIDNSIKKVEDGYQNANDTAEALDKIVSGVTDAVEIVGTIAEASNQQASAIEEINQGIEQISQVTQGNTATAEESASASEEMAGQAETLKNMIQEFKLKTTKKNTLKDKSEEIQDNHSKIQIKLEDEEFGKY